MRGRAAALMVTGCAAVALVAASTARAQYGSDGTITFVTYDKSGSSAKGNAMTQYTSAKKVRFEAADSLGQKQGAFIMDGGTGVFTILMMQNKQYMQITPQQAQAAVNQIKPGLDSLSQKYKDTTHVAQAVVNTPPPPPPTVTVTKIGSDVVAGVPCDVYDVTGTDNKGKTEEGQLCSAQGVGFFMMSAGMMGAAGPFGGAAMASNPAMQGQYAAWQQVLGGGRGIIKVWSVEKGKKQVVMEATKIDRTQPPDWLFEIPPGYTKFSFGSALSGGGNGKGGTTPGSVGQSVTSGATNSAAQGVQEVTDSAAKQGTKNAVKKLLHFP